MDRFILPLVPFGNVYWYAHFFSDIEVCVDPYENFIKQSHRNRFEILNHQGRFNLSIPVKGQKGVKTPLNQIELIRGDWKQLHLKTLKSSYNSSPYFAYYIDSLESFYSGDFQNLFDFSKASFEFIAEELNLELSLNLSEKYLEEGMDKRSFFKGKKSQFDHGAYQQVFSDRLTFESNLSILDLLFNLGPETELFLENQSVHP